MSLTEEEFTLDRLDRAEEYAKQRRNAAMRDVNRWHIVLTRLRAVEA